MHLYGSLGIQLKLGHLLRPGKPLVCGVIEKVVKDGSLRGKLDVFELSRPPL